MKNKRHIIIQPLLILAGLGLTLDTLLLAPISVINAGILMPAVLGIPLLLAGIFYRILLPKTKKGIGKAIKILFIAGYSAFIISFVVITSLIITKSKMEPEPGADAVIVLGAGIVGDQMTAVLYSRLNIAIDYLNDNPDTIIVVSGGQGPGESIPEAEAMHRELLRIGIPEERIIVEDKSRNTYENFQYSKVLLDEKFNGKEYRVVFTTTDFHIFRSGMIARDAGISAEGIGTKSLWYLIPNFYLREYLSLNKYWLMKLF